MPPIRVFWLTLIAACLVCGSASAWVSTSVKSSATVVDVQPDGRAKVSHEWLIRVRGGPLKSWTIDGVDEDAVVAPDATITRASSGRLAGVPIALEAEKLEGSLHFKLAYKKGVRTGSYLLRFSYLTDLLARGAIRSAGRLSAVEWQSPTYPDGIDSLKVEFVFRRGSIPPRMPGEADPTLSSSGDNVRVVSTDQGVFLSELRREAGTDVLSLTRPHAAKFEQVTWRVLVAPAVVGQTAEAVEHAPPIDVRPIPSVVTPKQTWIYAIALGFAFCFCGLLYWKLRSPHHQPLIKLRLRRRLPAVTLLLAASVWLALGVESPTWATILLALALGLSITQPIVHAPPVRGPGTWRAVRVADVVGGMTEQARGPRWLDVGTVPGFLLFALLLGSFVVLGLRLLGVSPYYSAMALLYATALVPLFCTVGSSKRCVLHEQMMFLEPLTSRLPKSLGRLELWARYPTGRSQPDELRLRCIPKAPVPGFRSCEVALEHVHGVLGQVSTPVLLLRVEEHSEAHRMLPRSAQWSRGRYAEERIAILRPSLPLRAVTLELMSDVLRRINRGKRAAPQRAA